jgi:uncharacterized protein (DUF1778 family)
MSNLNLTIAAPQPELHLNLPLIGHTKELIEEAALLIGQSLSDFILATAVKEATKVIEKHRQISFSNRDRDLFLALLDTDDEPNAALKEAVEHYRQVVLENN